MLGGLGALQGGPRHGRSDDEVRLARFLDFPVPRDQNSQLVRLSVKAMYWGPSVELPKVIFWLLGECANLRQPSTPSVHIKLRSSRRCLLATLTYCTVFRSLGLV